MYVEVFLAEFRGYVRNHPRGFCNGFSGGWSRLCPTKMASQRRTAHRARHSTSAGTNQRLFGFRRSPSRSTNTSPSKRSHNVSPGCSRHHAETFLNRFPREPPGPKFVCQSSRFLLPFRCIPSSNASSAQTFFLWRRQVAASPWPEADF
jgi:hypothetical protein